MVLKAKRLIHSIPKWFITLLLIAIGVTIFNYNNVFGENEFLGAFAFLYFILIFFLLARWLFKQIKSIIRLKNEKTKTELLHLKSQVNPHFFFNTLNNLYGLMEKDSKERQMVLKLSDMMRYSIYEGLKDWVTLKDELVYLQNYIELQEIRYHKKSDVQFIHQIENLDSKIMPLLFIILLENAFKHGLENLEKDAYIHMQLVNSENELNFEIENNFDAKQISSKKGIGLKNLQRRLALVYTNRHTLSFESNTDVYKVKLSLKLN